MLLCKKILNRVIKMEMAQQMLATKAHDLHSIPGIIHCDRREPTPNLFSYYICILWLMYPPTHTHVGAHSIFNKFNFKKVKMMILVV